MNTPARVICLALLVAVCGCSDAPVAPTDPDLETYNATARLEFDQDHDDEAARSYGKALDRAREMDDPIEIAAAAYNLAIVKAALADYASALALLDEAGYASSKAKLNQTDILLARAQVNLLAKNPAEASRCGEMVLQEPQAIASNSQRLQAHVSNGLAACQMSNVSEATNELDAATKLSADNPGDDSSAATGALIANLAGEIHLLTQEYNAAGLDFDRQASLSRQAHHYHTMQRALVKAGHAYSAGGKQGLAADRLYRAAAAAMAHATPDALRLANDASSAAQAAGDPLMVRLTHSLVVAATAATQPAE